MKILLLVIMTFALQLHAPLMLAADTETGTDSGSTTGIVAETLESGGYIYLKLKEQGTWVATSSITVSTGDQIQYYGGMEMRNFYSKTLARTFESIFFVGTVNVLSHDIESMHNTAMKGGGAEKMEVSKPVSVEAPVPGEIARLANGNTIAEIFAESSQLKDQPARLRARVIKVSENILGNNWITLQDGTGTEPYNKLLATSKELVEPGDLVIASGTIKTDTDIGSGYTYKVLLEKATFSQNSE
jgi:hypothetical protein